VVGVTTVLKLGGSVVTEKETPETVDEANLGRAAAVLGEVVGGPGDGPADLVVVHGGGSFGHHHASAHGLSRTSGTRDPAAVRTVHGAMHRLNRAVVDALAAEGVPALPIHPLSVATRRPDDGSLALSLDATGAMLGEGFVPVLHGDAVVHGGRGATILSGDELVVALARGLDADRAGLCSAVPGVLDDEGAVIPTIREFDAVADVLGASAATDVTGGMAVKVRELLALDVPAAIFDLDGLPAFLAGEPAGTRVE